MEKRITSKTRIYIQNFKEQLKNKIVNDNKLSKKEIINLLPHREPMLLIDELLDIVKLKSATAIMLSLIHI